MPDRRSPIEVESDESVRSGLSTLERGDVLAGRYRLEDRVARGGMGTVWAAYDTKLGIRLALKVIDLDVGDPKNLRARFYREASLSRQLRGRAFVEVFGHGIAAQRAWLAMELLDGETLLDRLRRAGALQPDEALGLLRGVAVGLRVAHALQIVHRDLKPSNIYLARVKPKSSGVQALGESTKEEIKLLDFGIAKDTWDDARLTLPDIMLGSAFYMSPEQIRSGRDVDTRADLWSLGVILFLCVTGKLPFRGSAAEALAGIVQDEPPLASSVAPRLSTRFDAFFRRALQKAPGRRFECIDEMVDAFAAAHESLPAEPELDAIDLRATVPAPQPIELIPEPDVDSGRLARPPPSSARMKPGKRDSIIVTWEPLRSPMPPPPEPKPEPQPQRPQRPPAPAPIATVAILAAPRRRRRFPLLLLIAIFMMVALAAVWLLLSQAVRPSL